MKRLRVLATLLVWSVLTGGAGTPDSVASDVRIPADCAVPSTLITYAPGLEPYAISSVRPVDVDILAVGSAAMLGPTGSPRDAFTYRAVDVLTNAYPGIRINLVARNARGALASDMLATLRTELAAHPHPLVLWQAGSVEALRTVPVAAFRQTLVDGATLVADAHGWLILIDTQFSRMMHSKIDVEPYEAVMREIGSRPGVTLFHRYELTREWVWSGKIDLESAPQNERQKTADRLNECLGHTLASVIGGSSPSTK